MFILKIDMYESGENHQSRWFPCNHFDFSSTKSESMNDPDVLGLGNNDESALMIVLEQNIDPDSTPNLHLNMLNYLHNDIWRMKYRL